MKDGKTNFYGIWQETDTAMVILSKCKWWNDQYSRNHWRTPVERRLTYLGLVVVTLNSRRNQAGFSIRGIKYQHPRVFAAAISREYTQRLHGLEAQSPDSDSD